MHASDVIGGSGWWNYDEARVWNDFAFWPWVGFVLRDRTASLFSAFKMSGRGRKFGYFTLVWHSWSCNANRFSFHSGFIHTRVARNYQMNPNDVYIYIILYIADRLNSTIPRRRILADFEVCAWAETRGPGNLQDLCSLSDTMGSMGHPERPLIAWGYESVKQN